MASYTTTANVRDETQIDYKDIGFQDETQYEDLLDELILAAERIIDNYCKVPSGFFVAAGLTVTAEHHDHDGSGVVHLRYYPILSVTSLEYNNAGLTQATNWTALTAGPGAGSSYLLYPEFESHGKIVIYSTIPSAGFRNIRSTYVAGYTAVPADITQITNEIVANIVRGILKRRLTPQDITQIAMSGGDIRAVFAEAAKLVPSQKKLLNEYMISEVKGRRG